MISMPGESFVFPSLPGVRGPKRVPYYLFIKDWVYVIIFTLNTMRLFGDGFQYSKECKYDEFLYYTPSNSKNHPYKTKKKESNKEQF